ncbi:MAG: hypothetical protein F4149_19190 [Gammaproteobacteria bacterium]|nr:hypothetical protein [Gammaproteobacteria bacterium]MYK84018.1 hypothetical protein [Gammaproteobacteria bacterium]
MPIHFARLPPELTDAALREPLITPNERLAREAAAACNQRQLDLGRRAWPRPRVASLRRYLHTRFDAAAANAQVLSPEAELLLWRDTAEPNSLHLAEWAAEAWALALAWRIDPASSAFEATANGRLFQRWAARFRSELKAGNWISAAELADAATPEAGDLHLLGFERIEPQTADWLARVERAGGRVHQHEAAESPALSERRLQLESQADEISAAAQWARQTLIEDGAARIGVVFPYLAAAYHAIDHAFGVEFADAADAFDISGGLPLTEQPVWRSAELLLDHVLEPANPAPESLLRAPFLDLPSPLSFEPTRGRQPFAAWVARFHKVLQQVRWGAAAGSVQHQARERVGDCMDRYSALSQRPNITAAEALRTLKDLLSAQEFAPERPPAPIQVLGYLETTGLQFSHLWVAGLSDANWPLSPAPNPLIPMELQRQCGIPRIDHPSEGAFAQRRVQHWRTACQHLTTSWFPAQAEGGEACSALIRPLTEVSIDVAVGNHRRRRHPWLAFAPEPASEVAPPDQATPLDAEIRSGTSLVRDQAECPFRAWAVHRLGVKAEQSMEPFPDALTRGTVVHEAFHKLYRDHERPFSDNDVSTAVQATVAEQLAHTPARFRANEQSRIEAIIHAWLEHEAKRPAFSVIGLEQDAELTMPGARFFLRIDRIDQDAATGAQIVIDYKTGAVSVNRLLDERLVEPQLPMYALTDERIRAVLYARVGDEEVKLGGWGGDSLTLGRSPEGGWDSLRDRWREQIAALIEEFRSGKADVAPHHPQTCRYCHLPSLCRVNAIMAAP